MEASTNVGPNTGFWDCSEIPLPDEEPIDESQCEEMLNKFGFIGVLGQGAYGIVARVKFLELEWAGEYAMKVSRLKDASHSLEIACALNTLLDGHTGIFVRTYGWLLCEAPPSDIWTSAIRCNKTLDRTLADEEPIMFTLMELSPITLSQDNFSLFPQDFAPLLLHILHGLYVARKQLQFSHEDLHGGNIMLDFVEKGRKATLEIEGVHYSAPFGRYSPRLIDFDFSQLGTDAEDTGPSTDLSSVFYAFMDKAWSQGHRDMAKTLRDITESPIFEAASSETRFQYQNLGALMLHPFFGGVLSEAPDTTTKIRCTVCSADAEHAQWENTRWAFCSKKCAESLRHIGELLNVRRI